jgi:hypothetical protein
MKQDAGCGCAMYICLVLDRDVLLDRIICTHVVNDQSGFCTSTSDGPSVVCVQHHCSVFLANL